MASLGVVLNSPHPVRDAEELIPQKILTARCIGFPAMPT